MAGERDEASNFPERVSATGDAYVAGRDIHVHLEHSGGAPSRDREALTNAVRATGRIPIAWNVPRRLNNFTGRTDKLDAIEQALNTVRPWEGGGRAVAITALRGLGGVGKTQLALEYA